MKFYTKKGYGDVRAAVFKRPAEEEIGLAPTVPKPTVGPTEVTGVVEPSPTLAAGQAAPSKKSAGAAKMAGGGALVAGGVGGAVALLAGPGAALSTGVRALAGLASAAATLGGGILASKGYTQYKEASKDLADAQRLRDIIDGKIPPGNLTPKDGNLTVSFDVPGAFLAIRDRVDPALPTEVEFFHKRYPVEVSMAAGTLPVVPQNVVGVNRPMNLFRIQGLNVGLPETNWKSVGYVRSVTHLIDLKRGWGGERGYVDGSANQTDFFDPFNQPICTVHSWRYGRGRDVGVWLAGGPPTALKRGGAGDQPPVEWHIDNVPEALFFDAGTNFWLKTAARAWLDAQAGYPAEDVSDTYPNPDEIKGPMGALMETYKAFRGLSAEPVTIYGSPQAFQQAVVHAAKVVDVRPWWRDIESFFGVVLGAASCVTQAAIPIITAINPTLGAAISAAASTIIGTAGNLYEAFTGTPRDLRARLDEGWSGVTNFYSDCESVAWGYWDAIGLEMPRDVQALYPADQVRDMKDRVYLSGSGAILGTVNTNPQSPIYINKLIGYVNKKV